jgi:hypothetical protein
MCQTHCVLKLVDNYKNNSFWSEKWERHKYNEFHVEEKISLSLLIKRSAFFIIIYCVKTVLDARFHANMNLFCRIN